MSGPTSLPLELDASLEVTIDASLEKCFQAALHEFGPGMVLPDGVTMNMKLEAFPGGRWFRDLGNNAGHLWGHVQVIKPPTLLEITGPMFMSHPAVNFIALRIKALDDNRTLATFRHQAIGPIDPQVKSHVATGWNGMLQGIKDHAENH